MKKIPYLKVNLKMNEQRKLESLAKNTKNILQIQFIYRSAIAPLTIVVAVVAKDS